MPGPNGTMGPAELEIGDSILMLADADAIMPSKTAKDLGGSPVNLCVYIEDRNNVIKRAKQNGAHVVKEPENRFYDGPPVTVLTTIEYIPLGHGLSEAALTVSAGR